MEIVDDDGFPEPPTELEELRREVKMLMIYVKTLSEMQRNTHSRLSGVIRALRSRGVSTNDGD
jgi:hypothetical protein